MLAKSLCAAFRVACCGPPSAVASRRPADAAGWSWTFTARQWPARIDRLAGKVTMRYGLGQEPSRSFPGDAAAGRWAG